jgi:hypothetical protein
MKASRLHLGLLLLQALCLAGITLLVSTLTLDAIQGPVASYRSVAVLTPAVRAGQHFEARVAYAKFRDCGGTGLVLLTHSATGEVKRVSTIALGDRTPGEFSVIRRFQVPADAALGPSQFTETLHYQCPEGPSLVRSPPMPVIVRPQAKVSTSPESGGE